MERIGKYDIISELGQGGMGAVYKGRDSIIGRDVAIKVIHERALNAPSIKKRFYREAQSAGRLAHENITVIYDIGEEGETPYLVMEYLEGSDLRDMLNKGASLSNQEKISIAIQICRGLDYAHRQGIIHRDIKPENIRVLPNGRIKIMDFGIARIQNETQGLTQTNLSLGTPRYMSPEQVKGEELDGRSDIFAFGVMLYELLTGENPFMGDHVTTIIYKILHAAPEPIQIEPGELSDGLHPIVERCLAKDRDERYQSFEAVLSDLLPFYAAPDQTASIHNQTLAEELPPVDETVALATSSPTAKTIFSPLEHTPMPIPQASSRPQGPRAAAPPPSAPPASTSKKPLWAALGVVVVLVLAGGGYLLFRPDAATDGPRETATVPPTDNAENNIAALDSALAVADTLSDQTTLPDPEDATPVAPPDADPNRTAADRERSAMDRARRRVRDQGDDAAVASAYRDAEQTRRAGNREYDSGDFSEAERSFRSAREAYESIQRTLAANTATPSTEGEEAAIDGLIATPEAATDEASRTAADQARSAMQAAKGTVAASLQSNASYQDGLASEREGNTAYAANNFDLAATHFNKSESSYKKAATASAPDASVARLAQRLKSALEQKDAATMQNTFFVDWSNFFQIAQDISATVNPGPVQVTSTRAMVDVQVQLRYKNNKNEEQRPNPITYTWTLKLDEGTNNWVIERVITQ